MLESGRPFGLLPMGLDALDVARVEAGFVLNGVDYTSARTAFIDRQKSTPFELGFDWMVQLDREPFVGQAALAAERERGAARRLVGLEIDWDGFEAIHDSLGLVPHLETATCREGVPIYRHGAQIGYATSRTWSPLLKKYLALATVGAEHAVPGSRLEIEVTCEYERHTAGATVVRDTLLRSGAQEGMSARRNRSHWDAIIVGGGHNALVAAAYLAKAGRRVLVLERRHVLGGAAVSEELHPGFTYSVCSYVVSLLRPWIIRELELPRFGLDMIPLESSFLPLPDGRSMCRWADPEETRDEVSRFSARDAERLPEFSRAMSKIGRFVRPLIDAPAPAPASLSPKELLALLRLGKHFSNAPVDRARAAIEAADDERRRLP